MFTYSCSHDLEDRVPEELCIEVPNIVQEVVAKTVP